jgi:phenylacetate-CoA ligase
MYSTIIKDIFFPMYQRKLPRDERYTTYLNLYNKSQWWSSADLEKYQLLKLKQLLKQADTNVPYYHDLFKKQNLNPEHITSIKELDKLPILTKEIVNKNFTNLYARNYPKNKLILSTTSGSTGIPMKFYIDPKWQACNISAAYRAWGWAGYKIGDKMITLWGAQQDASGTRMIDRIRENLMRKKYLDAFELTDENMAAYVKAINGYKPKIINSYASAIAVFSEYLKRKDIKIHRPKAILTTADMLYPPQRKSIEDAFGCDVFDYYSGRDTSFQAAECPEHSGYHMSIENAVVEFMNDHEHISPGETGKIILTDLCNYAMPLIRYEIGDLGSPSDEQCSCGRCLPLMKSFKGRIFDFILTPEGNRISGEYFHCVIIEHDIKSIQEFQIIQESLNKLVVYIVKNQNEKVDDVNKFINVIQQKVGVKMKIEVEYVSSIKRTSSGKLRHVISHISKTDQSSG